MIFLENRDDETVTFRTDSRPQSCGMYGDIPDGYPEIMGPVGIMRHSGRRNEQLGWHAADPCAGGTARAPLDHHDIGVPSCCGFIRLGASGSRTDNYDIATPFVHYPSPEKTVGIFRQKGGGMFHRACVRYAG